MLAIRPGVVHHWQLWSNSKVLVKLQCDMQYDNAPLVHNKGSLGTLKLPHILWHKLHQFLVRLCFPTWHQVSHFGQLVNYCLDTLEPIVNWLTRDQVIAVVFPWSSWYE